MMISDAFKSHIDPVRMELNGTQHILISHIFDSDKRKSKGIIAEKTYCKSVLWTIVDESSTEESESESVHKSINTNKGKY